MDRKYLIILLLSGLVGACSQTSIVDTRKSADTIPLSNFFAGAERSKHEAVANHFMVSSQGEATTKAGAQMFALGGNAFDAAAAMSFVIAVERPHSTGIGGGGFMLIHHAVSKKTFAVDFREKAPSAAREKMFLDGNEAVIPRLSLDGPLSVSVPGMVAGVLEVQAKYGRLKRAEVMAPAIELAEKGFPVYPHLEGAIRDRRDTLAKFPDSKKIFLHADGTGYKVGEILVQKDLAQSLRNIASEGPNIFYHGKIADALVASQKQHGGILEKRDLENYNVVWRTPAWGTFQGFTIASMPPPSSGGVHVLEILNILEGMDIGHFGAYSDQTVHYTAAAMQQAFADRAKYLGDSDFVKVPTDGLISKEYARGLRNKIHAELATPSKDLRAGNPWPFQNPHESDQTTHFTVMDKEGNTIASTQTLNTEFGSCLVAEGTGILFNNEMDDFSVKPGVPNAYGALGGKENAVGPGKRPLSSMSPTIVFDGKTPVLALGTPSGTRIISCVTQTILNYLAYKMPLYEAVGALRYHDQWSPDEIRVDPPGFSATLTQKLRAKGYSVRVASLGCQVNAIAREKGQLHGVADMRGEGMSIGE